MNGKKTYLVSVCMIVYALLGYFLGYSPSIDWKVVFEGLGLAALRHAIVSQE